MLFRSLWRDVVNHVAVVAAPFGVAQEGRPLGRGQLLGQAQRRRRQQEARAPLGAQPGQVGVKVTVAGTTVGAYATPAELRSLAKQALAAAMRAETAEHLAATE